MTDIIGSNADLAEQYAGKVVLAVNVASACGFTPQYAGLQQLHEKYAAQGLAVVGFPCNQFGAQEPGTHDEILDFCRTTYSVQFDVLDKIDVNGPDASELYQYMTGPDAPVDDQGPVEWNFEKFLIGRDGKLIARYRSKVEPLEIAADIETALAD